MLGWVADRLIPRARRPQPKPGREERVGVEAVDVVAVERVREAGAVGIRAPEYSLQAPSSLRPPVLDDEVGTGSIRCVPRGVHGRADGTVRVQMAMPSSWGR